MKGVYKLVIVTMLVFSVLIFNNTAMETIIELTKETTEKIISLYPEVKNYGFICGGVLTTGFVCFSKKQIPTFLYCLIKNIK